ncbi:hypothetical protein [Pseudomonas mangiferae]|uniref:Uncharacterized protein n=1 Tax=Pseudomonas mangiferae TaxID=2593654 RepID=A0A553GWW5_9PSED|nr:hypothetical protein [Pseudomonas mangiferae]TRX73965.1 hypothetical protein FM069_14560 [Pseudomonas mangiferae]
MSQKALYEIQYKLLGEPHADLITDLNVPVIDVVQELARKHNVAVNDDNAVAVDEGVPLVVPITDVHIHSVSADDVADGSH